MDRRMKIGMAWAAFAGVGVAAFLWSCVATPPPTPPTAITPPPVPPAAIAPPTPKPVVLTKPPMLGPVIPNIVILPAHMDEPEIRVKLTAESDSPPAIVRSQYRGRIDILRLANGNYVAVNSLPLESYVEGVVVKELLGSWAPATFRAQAIAARTFALFQMMATGPARQWDVNSDQSSQVYAGITRNTTALTAVAATRGQVLTATVNGKTGIFCSFYSACIGGASQDPFEAWGDPSVPPLAAHLTGNVDDNDKQFNWDRDFVATQADVTRCVQNWGARNSFPYLQALGNVVSVIISKRNQTTRRPTELLLTDAAGKSAPIRAEEFRLALLNDPTGKAPKPYSSNFEIRPQGDTFVMYNGHGFGHGIGMSQWGAQNLALKGYSHTQILSFFYPGSGLQQLW